MLGGLHIEQAALKAFGTWLAGSGWVEVLSQAKITTAGKERNRFSTVHILRALGALLRNLQQVFFILQKQECRKYVKSVQKGKEPDSICTWRSKKETAIPIQIELIQEDGGENPSVLLKWMVSGPELARDQGIAARRMGLDVQREDMATDTARAHCLTQQCSVKSSPYVAARPAGATIDASAVKG
ncbi:hypothetical protein ACROYT_G033467 [Oculina patagonica]